MDKIESLRERVRAYKQSTGNQPRPSSVRSRQPLQAKRALDLASLRRAQEQAAPILAFISSVVETLGPAYTAIFNMLSIIWTALKPYHPEDLFVAVYGFFLVFFGGVFMTLVASVEAAHQFGWERIKLATTALYIESAKASRAFERDNKIDSNRDGIADVQQISASELTTRRIMVVSKSVDPETVSVALEGLTMATVAILATLRVRFAKAITLGSAIGDVLHQMFSPFTSQVLEYALPSEFEKWIPMVNKYGFRYVGVSASWVLLRAVTSVFAAMRGSSLFVTGMCAYLARHKYVRSDIFKQGNAILVGAWACLALFGIYWQVSMRFSLPFPLNLVLLPLSIAERVVVFMLGTSV